MNNFPLYQDIQHAHERISPFIHKTPVMTSRNLDQKFECNAYLKCENLQKTGSFKIRGAMNAILVKQQDPARGVATHSSGNHAAALAFSAQMQNLPCTIIMPSNAPRVKRAAVQSYGANIIDCEPTMDSRISTLEKHVKATGAMVIPPYDDPDIIAGQGTSVLELLQEIPDLDTIIVPVGGGGLASGTCITAKSIKPGIRVYGVEPELADDALRSLKAGRIIPSQYPATVADGLRTSLGEYTFAVLQHYIDGIFTVTEEEIITAMRMIWERMKIIIEPSSAVPVAAVLFQKIPKDYKRVGIIISGGNVSLDAFPVKLFKLLCNMY